MLTPFDDYPIHQTPLPLAHPGTSHPDQYDRYFFNGYDLDGDFFLGGAMGHYPNRDVIDAAFSVIHEGVQHSIFASGRIPLDRTVTRIGPICIEVVEPLRTLRLVVEPNEHGITADLTWQARTVALEEPRQTIQRGTVQVMDYTRLTQWGSWAGTIAYGDTELEVDAATTRGTRDRSWGIRGVGEPTPTNLPRSAPQIFWLWAPLSFDDVCTHLALFEYADGERWLESACILPVIGADDPVFGPDDGVEHMASVDYDLTWQEGRREMAGYRQVLRASDGTEHEVTFEPLYTFRMRGIGYTHPHWKHGSAHGDLEVGAESIPLDEFDPKDPSCVHIQTLCKVTMGDRHGTGILEQLAFGDHAPTGLTGLL
jgi:hypothetical protein